jgi:hypothetical protein
MDETGDRLLHLKGTINHQQRSYIAATIYKTSPRLPGARPEQHARPHRHPLLPLHQTTARRRCCCCCCAMAADQPPTQQQQPEPQQPAHQQPSLSSIKVCVLVCPLTRCLHKTSDPSNPPACTHWMHPAPPRRFPCTPNTQPPSTLPTPRSLQWLDPTSWKTQPSRLTRFRCVQHCMCSELGTLQLDGSNAHSLPVGCCQNTCPDE